MLPELQRKKILLVSSAGGHLAELLTLANTAGINGESMWVVPETAQSRSLLEGRRTLFVPYVGPRGVVAALHAARRVDSLLRHERFDACLSTGAAIAAFALPLASARRIPSIYVESLARADGPSLTGRILRMAPGVRTLTQSSSWAGRTWPYAGTILDDFVAEVTDRQPGPLRIFVTFGTIRPYRFDRAVQAILEVITPDDEVVWQLGHTTRKDLPGVLHDEMTSTAIRNEMSAADVVLAHAGVGSVIDALAVGKAPVLLVRRRVHAEHVDNHQEQLAAMVSQKRLGEILDLERPDRSKIMKAANLLVRPADQRHRARNQP